MQRTEPSGSFATQPVIGNVLATDVTYHRKPTPWTRPRTTASSRTGLFPFSVTRRRRTARRACSRRREPAGPGQHEHVEEQLWGDVRVEQLGCPEEPAQEVDGSPAWEIRGSRLELLEQRGVADLTGIDTDDGKVPRDVAPDLDQHGQRATAFRCW